MEDKIVFVYWTLTVYVNQEVILNLIDIAATTSEFGQFDRRTYVQIIHLLPTEPLLTQGFNQLMGSYALKISTIYERENERGLPVSDVAASELALEIWVHFKEVI
jgi:hypothetical protein